MSASLQDTYPPSHLQSSLSAQSKPPPSVDQQDQPLVLPSSSPGKAKTSTNTSQHNTRDYNNTSEDSHPFQDDPFPEYPYSPSSLHMQRRTNGTKQQQPQQDGDQNSAMNTQPIEHRRKYGLGDDENTADQAERLMARQEFTLDEDPIHPIPGKDDGSASGFWDLPEKDRRNFLVLVLLYFLQGIPMGLAGGSVPFLLKSHLSYGQIGVFSLASYPYSLKLLWSPIVDAVWSRRIGRRKSWILPVQMFSGFGMLWLGAGAESMMEKAGADGGAGIWNFTWWWFFLVFTCATQDIAVDGKI
jgi:hypothetical protein